MSREFTLDFQPLYHPERIFLEFIHVCTALFGEGREDRESKYIHVVEAKSTQGKFNRSTLSYRQACLSHHQIFIWICFDSGKISNLVGLFCADQSPKEVFPQLMAKISWKKGPPQLLKIEENGSKRYPDVNWHICGRANLLANFQLMFIKDSASAPEEL